MPRNWLKIGLLPGLPFHTIKKDNYTNANRSKYFRILIYHVPMDINWALVCILLFGN